MKGGNWRDQKYQNLRRAWREECHGQWYRKQQRGLREQGLKHVVDYRQIGDRSKLQEGQSQWNEISCKQIEKE